MLIIVVLFITLANLMQVIYCKTLIMGIYKMHINEVNIKNNYSFENFVKAKKLETESI